MLAVTRRKEIVELLKEQGMVSVSDLSRRYGITEETVRKDLQKLEEQGFLQRTHGGAIEIPNAGQELPFAIRNLTHKQEKTRIAIEAAKCVSDYDVIVLDASSTSLQLAYHLKDKKEVTVVTNSLNVLNALKDCPSVQVFCAGGFLRTQSLCFVGEATEEMIKRCVINKAFISTRGITIPDGLLEPNEQEARVKKTMIEAAKKIFLLQDHSKFGQSAFYPIARIDQIDCVITDKEMPKEFSNRFEEQGIQVILASEEKVGT